MLTRTRMTDWLLGLLVACSLSTTLLVVSPAGAQKQPVEAEPTAAPTLAETEEAEEASAEASEAAAEAAEVAAAQAEEAAFSHFSLSSKAAEEYPSMYKRIANLEAIIAKLKADKQKLRELPLHSKRRKAFLPRKHERIMEERHRLGNVYRKIREKKEAARA